VSCLPVPPGPTGAPRCLLLFHPLARPQPRLPEPAPSGSDAAPAPSGGPHAAPPEAGVAAEAAAGCADAAPREGAGQAADPGSRPSAAEEGAAAPGPPPPVGAGSAQGSASAAEDAQRASGAGDAGADPNPGVEAAAAARQAAAASVLRGMALVDGIAAGSPFQRCSVGFQARPPRGSARAVRLSAACTGRAAWVTALQERTQARAFDCTRRGCPACKHVAQRSALVATLVQCRRLTPDAPKACGSAAHRRVRTAPAGGNSNPVLTSPPRRRRPMHKLRWGPASKKLRPQEVTGYAEAAVRGRGCLCLAGPLSEGRAGRALLPARRAAAVLPPRRAAVPVRAPTHGLHAAAAEARRTMQGRCFERTATPSHSCACAAAQRGRLPGPCLSGSPHHREAVRPGAGRWW